MKLVIEYHRGKKRFIEVTEVEVIETDLGLATNFINHQNESWGVVMADVKRVTLDGEILYADMRLGENL